MKAYRWDRNIVLVGMPGVGKSTIGVLVAKRLGMPFVDTDISIQAKTGKQLHEIISEHGIEYFKLLEEQYICEINDRNTVIATGGSVIYSERGMRHLKNHGLILWLSLSYENLVERLGDLDARGVIRADGQSLLDLYREREPLYERYADLRVDCDGMNHCELIDRIATRLTG